MKEPTSDMFLEDIAARLEGHDLLAKSPYYRKIGKMITEKPHTDALEIIGKLYAIMLEDEEVHKRLYYVCDMLQKRVLAATPGLTRQKYVSRFRNGSVRILKSFRNMVRR